MIQERNKLMHRHNVRIAMADKIGVRHKNQSRSPTDTPFIDHDISAMLGGSLGPEAQLEAQSLVQNVDNSFLSNGAETTQRSIRTNRNKITSSKSPNIDAETSKISNIMSMGKISMRT